jgi:hypothetical protein
MQLQHKLLWDFLVAAAVLSGLHLALYRAPAKPALKSAADTLGLQIRPSGPLRGAELVGRWRGQSVRVVFDRVVNAVGPPMNWRLRRRTLVFLADGHAIETFPGEHVTDSDLLRGMLDNVVDRAAKASPSAESA